MLSLDRSRSGGSGCLGDDRPSDSLVLLLLLPPRMNKIPFSLSLANDLESNQGDYTSHIFQWIILFAFSNYYVVSDSVSTLPFTYLMCG